MGTKTFIDMERHSKKGAHLTYQDFENDKEAQRIFEQNAGNQPIVALFIYYIVPGEENAPLLGSLSVTSTGGSISLSPTFSSETKSYGITASGTIFVLASPQSDSCNVSVLYNGVTTRANGKSVTCADVASGDKIYIIVDNGSTEADSTSTYTISVS